MRVRFEPSGKSAEVEAGTTVMEACEKVGLILNKACDGDFLCGFCKVMVLEGLESLSEMTTDERKVLAALGAQPNHRLACQARIQGDLTVTTEYW